jgi:hypothetical protein
MAPNKSIKHKMQQVLANLKAFFEMEKLEGIQEKATWILMTRVGVNIIIFYYGLFPLQLIP